MHLYIYNKDLIFWDLPQFVTSIYNLPLPPHIHSTHLPHPPPPTPINHPPFPLFPFPLPPSPPPYLVSTNLLQIESKSSLPK